LKIYLDTSVYNRPFDDQSCACRNGTDNYLSLKEELFKDETVDTLYKKISEFEKKKGYTKSG